MLYPLSYGGSSATGRPGSARTRLAGGPPTVSDPPGRGTPDGAKALREADGPVP